MNEAPIKEEKIPTYNKKAIRTSDSVDYRWYCFRIDLIDYFYH